MHTFALRTCCSHALDFVDACRASQSLKGDGGPGGSSAGVDVGVDVGAVGVGRGD